MTRKVMRTAACAAPARIDLAGGTVDLWPLYLFHPPAVTVNAAVNLYAHVTVAPDPGGGCRVTDRDGGKTVSRRNPESLLGVAGAELFGQVLRHLSVEGGLRIDYASEVPRGAGLAGSSALVVALCVALLRGAGERIRRDRLPALARDIETCLLRVPAGMQDYYPALWGGVQALWWEVGTVRRERLEVDVGELERRMLLVYTGTSRYSGANNWEIFKGHVEGDPRIFHGLERITRAACRMVEALRGRDYDGVGRILDEEATARRRLFPGIVTPEIRRLERVARRNGAVGVKVCGAGGGGCVVLYVAPEGRERLSTAVREAGFAPLPFQIDRKGLSFRWTTGNGGKPLDIQT